MPPVKMTGDGRKAKNPGKTMLRLLRYMKQYRIRLVLVVVCILIAAVASVVSNKSLQYLVDDYIAPMLTQQNPDFTPLVHYVIRLGCIFLAGLIANFLHSLLMVRIGQGLL